MKFLEWISHRTGNDQILAVKWIQICIQELFSVQHLISCVATNFLHWLN